MIWIRADANSEIGTGHVMRCITIAKEIQKRGVSVCFILADEFPVKMLSDNHIAYKVLHTKYDEPEKEIPILREWLCQASPQILLVDSYFVTKEYFAQIRKYTKVAYVDDFCHTEYPVDILINYNIYGDKLPYREKMKEEAVQLLLGTEYAPVREEFVNTDYLPRKEAEHVLITTGGSDKYNLAGLIVEKAMQSTSLCELHYHVVSGMFNPNAKMLDQIAESNSHVQIHHNVTNMAELMKQCDVAITAGGSTIYELCAVGLPMIAFSFVENQEKQIEVFFEKEIIAFGGHYLRHGERMIEEILRCLEGLTVSYENRKEYSDRGKRVVDGQGACRIAEKLLKKI